MALIVVTGASAGVGEATARRYAARGDTVVIVARREARLNELAAELEALGGTAVVEALDGGDGAAVVEMAERVVSAHGAPDVVVNSAGAGVWRYPEDTPPELLESMLAAPFKSAFHTTHAFLPAMLERKQGVIVNINSPACFIPWAGSTGYASVRWALRGLHEALRMDLHGTGVTPCHVIFGEISSEYFDANPDSHDHIPSIGRLIPITTPEKCGEIVQRAADRRRNEVTYPFMAWAFQVSLNWAPGIIRPLVRATGRQRS